MENGRGIVNGATESTCVTASEREEVISFSDSKVEITMSHFKIPIMISLSRYAVLYRMILINISKKPFVNFASTIG